MIAVGLVMMLWDRQQPGPLASPSTGDLENAITQLNRNYELLRRQTTQGFLISCVFMTLGFLVILVGSLGDLFGLTQGGDRLAIIAGLLTEFISATGLAIYTVNFRRLNLTHDRLHEAWKILTAFKQAKELPPGAQEEVMVYLVEALVAMPKRKPKPRRASKPTPPASANGHGSATDKASEKP